MFAFAPYRFAHIGHLELQWVVWMPVGLLCLHRLFEMPTWRAAVLLGAALGAQALCSVYYGAFLSMYLAVGGLVLLTVSQHRARGSCARQLRSCIGGRGAVYAPPYFRRNLHAPASCRTYPLQRDPSDVFGCRLKTTCEVAGASVAPDSVALRGAIPMGLPLGALFHHCQRRPHVWGC